MKSPRKIIFVTLAALAGAAAILVHAFNLAAGQHLDSVQQELRKLLGLDVRFASIAVHLGGRPGFAARELRVADDPRFAATPILRAKEVVLGIRLWPLLRGRIVIDSLTLRAPEFQIIVDETGLFNLDLLTQRRNEFPPPVPPRAAPTERRTGAVSFAVDLLRIEDGRVVYLDRSVKQAAELQLGDIELTLRGLDKHRASHVRLAAALTEGLGQDLHIDGEFDPAAAEQPWLGRRMNLTIRSESLNFPVLARAVTALRDRVPREIEMTGPMSFQARAVGTLARPQFEDVTLKAQLFGSSDYNATLTGAIRFSERRSWEDAELNGALTLDPLPLAPLRKVTWLRQNVFAALSADGTIGVFARFEGTWDKLRVGALVRADKSEWKYQDWLRKPLDRPAAIRARIARSKDKLFFHESELVSGTNQLGFLGLVDIGNQPKLQLRVYSRHGQLRDWREMILPDLLIGATGQTDLNVVIDRNMLPEDTSWSVQGYLKLANGMFKPNPNGRAIEGADGTLTFNGRQAKLTGGRFRVGSSVFNLDGAITDLFQPAARYQLRSPQLVVADLNLFPRTPAIRLQNFNAEGAVQLRSGALLLDGTCVSPAGRIGVVDFRDLRADINWSASRLELRNLSLRAFDGNLSADGYLADAANSSASFELATQAEAVALSALGPHLWPALKDRVQGQLNGHSQFSVISTPGAKAQIVLKGSGEAQVQNGMIKDFNLISQLLLRGSGAAVSAQSMARVPAGFAKLLSRSDTVVDFLKADFIVEPERVRTDNLVLATPEYTVTGAGWVGYDRSTKWNGLLVLSPRLTQEVQRDVRLLRYLLDRRGRLAVTFRVDGAIPNVRIRLDNRALAQTLRGGERDGERETPDRQDLEPGADKKWLPDALERFLGR
jgi:uncharacterized protein involved in outer membrane biogenesis